MPIAAGGDLDQVLAAVAARSDCRLLPPAGPAGVTDGLPLPDDLRRFHARCGGAVLFTGTEYQWQVGVPNRVVAASPRLLTPEIAAGVAVENPQDLTNSCFVIADGGRDSSTDPTVVIDLHPDRLGRCYLAFWDTFGVVGEMPVIAVTMGELLRVLLEHEGQVTASPDRYGDAYEPRLPLPPKRITDLDAQWLSRWREDMTQVIASVMTGFEARVGYPPGENHIGRQVDSADLEAIDDIGPLAAFSRLVGEVSLPDIGNGWFVLTSLRRARIGPPHNMNVVMFASDGGGTIYALPTATAGPVLRLREVGETAAGVFDGERVEESAPDLRAFLTGLHEAATIFARTGDIVGL